MSLMETMNIGQKSLEAHGARIKIHAKNIANLDTPNYVRKIPVLNATDDISFHVLIPPRTRVFGNTERILKLSRRVFTCLTIQACQRADFQ